ncbi:MAG: hypothetical protein AB8B97_11530 [Granulosicoccus sp.]
MSKSQSFVFIVLLVIMILAANTLGNWSEQINPEGITPHPAVDGEEVVEQRTPRDAFSFGVSMGLLGCALAYSCVAFGLMIRARSRRQKASHFTYWLAGLAGLGFVLSYLVDDYFY